MPTDRQISRLYALARNAGLTHADVTDELQARYGVASSRGLSPAQYEAYTADLIRRNTPVDGVYRDGAYSAPHHLREFAAGCRQFGRLWPGAMTEGDVTALTILLDDWRRYRARTRALSQRQMDGIVRMLGRYPIVVFRAAAAIWLERYRTGHDEKYFKAICEHLQRDEASRRAGLQGRLEVV